MIRFRVDDFVALWLGLVRGKYFDAFPIFGRDEFGIAPNALGKNILFFAKTRRIMRSIFVSMISMKLAVDEKMRALLRSDLSIRTNELRRFFRLGSALRF